MKKVIFALALATMIISCKETKKEEKVEEVKEMPAPEPTPEMTPDTMTTKTETTVDSMQTNGDNMVKKTEKTTKAVK